MFYFLSGFTAKLAGTEIGVTEPQPTFSACFGAPFLPQPPSVYAHMLGDKLDQHPHVTVWLVNTGWTGGPFGEGERMPIKATRALLKAALSGELDGVEYRDGRALRLRGSRGGAGRRLRACSTRHPRGPTGRPTAARLASSRGCSATTSSSSRTTPARQWRPPARASSRRSPRAERQPTSLPSSRCVELGERQLSRRRGSVGAHPLEPGSTASSAVRRLELDVRGAAARSGDGRVERLDRLVRRHQDEDAETLADQAVDHIEEAARAPGR